MSAKIEDYIKQDLDMAGKSFRSALEVAKLQTEKCLDCLTQSVSSKKSEETIRKFHEERLKRINDLLTLIDMRWVVPGFDEWLSISRPPKKEVVLRWYDGKPMTTFEQEMWNEGRCIACGSSKTVYATSGRGREHHQECEDCKKARTRNNVGSGLERATHARGSGRASMHHEFSKRMGYGGCAGGAPDKDNE